MKIILNWLRNVLTAIKNFLWPFEDLGIEKANKESLLLMTEPFRAKLCQISEVLEGDLTLYSGDSLVGCNISGQLTLEGTDITVESCRIEKSLFLTNLCTKGCKVKGNYLRANVYVSRVFEANDTNEFLHSNRVVGQVFRGEK